MTFVNIQAYFDYAASFTAQERQLQEQFASWLPEHIIDVHGHSGLPEHVRYIPQSAFKHMLSTFPSFTLEQSKSWQELLYPNSNVRSLRFALPFRGIDHRLANSYLLEHSPLEDRVALYGLPDDLEYTVNMLKHPRVSALKMYHSYSEPVATEIYQYFRPDILAATQELEVPIILHPPVIISKCLGQLQRLFQDFPRLKVVVAHLGLTKQLVPGLEQAYNYLADFPQVFLDSAMVPSREVVTMALQIFGPHRVMYGSDQPLHLIRAVACEHPVLGQRLAVDFPYHWADPGEQAEHTSLAGQAVLAYWQCLVAIREALEQNSPSEQAWMKRKIFHDNAVEVFRF